MSFYKFQLPEGEAVSSDFGLTLKMAQDAPAGPGGEPGGQTVGMDDPQHNPNLDFAQYFNGDSMVPTMFAQDRRVIFLSWYRTTVLSDQASSGWPLGLLGLPEGTLIGRLAIVGDIYWQTQVSANVTAPHEEITWSFAWSPSLPGASFDVDFIPIGETVLMVAGRSLPAIDGEPYNYPQQFTCTITARSSRGSPIAPATIELMPYNDGYYGYYG